MAEEVQLLGQDSANVPAMFELARGSLAAARVRFLLLRRRGVGAGCKDNPITDGEGCGMAQARFLGSIIEVDHRGDVHFYGVVLMHIPPTRSVPGRWTCTPACPTSISNIVTWLALSAVEANAQNAKSALLSSCYAAQAASSASASLPRYIAISLNKSYSTAINDSLNAAQAALDLSITVVEAVIDFFVDTYRSTFLCFLELVVQAGLAVLAAAVAEISNGWVKATTFVESAANSVANAIQQSFSAVISGIQSAISAANKVPGINIPTPTLSPPDMSSLQSLTLPTTFEDQLNNLNTKLPTLNELRQIVDNMWALIYPYFLYNPHTYR
ncbi:hypothetical protein B0H10DRAFT_1956157 [Mycena sp. CBHHK59/15]|nr:hypothetical protein B0H10DRAFT_1956157 [Mycena sp. CBHHK59/15]